VHDIVDSNRQAVAQETEIAFTPAQEESVTLKPKRKRAAAIANRQHRPGDTGRAGG